MGNILGFVGDIASAEINSEAQKSAVKMQMDALNKQRNFVFNNLDPATLGPLASQADVQRVRQQLALQGQIDPALLQTRYQAEGAMQDQLSKLTSDSSPAAQVANQAAKEALAPTPGSADAKKRLVDAALADLKAGATLPPDVEAQLVQAGLERSGTVTGRASAQGAGGTMLRTILGTEGIKLQAQRQQQAAGLLGTAQQLESQRSQVLQSLFPSLAARQTANLGAAAGAFNTANSAVPQNGLSGSDVANIWMARVGATNQLTQSAANTAAQGAMAQGQIWGNAVGAAGRQASTSVPAWKNMFSSSSTPGTNNASLGQADFGGATDDSEF